MALTVDTKDGPLEIHDLVIQAVVQNAERQAMLTAVYLTGIGLRPGSAEVQRIPRAALRELGAFLQLWLWDVQGILGILPPGLPTVAQAAARLHALITSDLSSTEAYEMPPLARCVQEAWLNHMAWGARAIMHADVVLGETDENTLIDAIARLIWANRLNQVRDKENLAEKAQ